MNLPDDPMILLSYVNTMLRDSYGCLDDLCLSTGADREYIIKKLETVNYHYDEAKNKFV